ncbi:hypothetical protein D3C81_375420 [compost metagenome]
MCEKCVAEFAQRDKGKQPNHVVVIFPDGEPKAFDMAEFVLLGRKQASNELVSVSNASFEFLSDHSFDLLEKHVIDTITKEIPSDSIKEIAGIIENIVAMYDTTPVGIRTQH